MYFPSETYLMIYEMKWKYWIKRYFICSQTLKIQFSVNSFIVFAFVSRIKETMH